MITRQRLHARLTERAPAEHDADARAAVATIVRPHEDGAQVLLIQRAEHPNDPWSGHMAFPGGRHDPGDHDLHHTAVRETAEEIGLPLTQHADPLGALDDVPTHTTGLVVRPYVFWLRETPPLVLERSEVAAVHWANLGAMMRGERDTTHELAWKGQTHRLPAYEVADRIVWGLTYRMLSTLFERLRE